MADYNSSHVGNDIDTVVDAVQAAVTADGIVNVKGLNTILGNYLTSSSAANTYAPLTGTGTSGTWPISINGSAVSLKNTQTIWGQNFNGTANISGNLTDVGAQLYSASGNTELSFLTSIGAALNGKFGRLGLSDGYASINLTNYRFHCNGGHARFDGTINIYPGATNNWTEGLRIHSSTAGWTTLILCGTDNTGDSGTSANSWSIHSYNGNFYITKNGSNTNTYFYNEGIWRFANLGIGGSYADSALQIFSTLSGGPSGWGGAPRLGFHWSGVNAAQLGVASNGYIYECPGTGTTFYQVQINTGSSRTIKHDIMPLPDMGDKIDLLQPVSFIYDDHPEEGTRYGLIHEDTVEIMPDICKFDENQNGGRTVNYIDLIPVLIKEIQSLRKRLKSLEDKNN